MDSYKLHRCIVRQVREIASNPLRTAFILLMAAVFLSSTANALPPGGLLPGGQAGAFKPATKGAYWAPKACSNCHQRMFGQYMESMHARAFSDPVFQNLLYNVLLPQAKDNPELMRRAGLCLSCHSPTTFLTQSGRLPPRDQLGEEPLGVTCDFCHTVTGYEGSAPGRANYISSPGGTKYGPLKFETGSHHEYSALHTRSEFCAICHEGENAYGVRTRSTYSEWETSLWPEKGIQCQDCHMSAAGYLIEGAPVFESGTVAGAGLLSPPERKQAHTHLFPGSSVPGQIKVAVNLRVQNFPDEARAGSGIIIGVELDNSKAGHSLPTGAIELRLMWLDVRLREKDSGREWRLAAKPDPRFRWDVARKSPTDAAMLGAEIVDGSRLYRAVMVDKNGRQTHNYWETTDKIFDNRLKAGEVRVELFHFTLPADASGSLEAGATLRYLRYPPGFAELTGIYPADSVIIARAIKTFEISR